MDYYLTALGWGAAVLQSLLYAALAPLLVGWVRKVKARLQNRRGASVLQPYRDLYKLLAKEARVAHTASPLFRAAPYVVFAATWMAASTVPLLAVDLPVAAVADIIVLVGLLALARVFLALAGMDVGTAFGGMGASREMLIGALAEPAMLMAVFTLTMTAHSTNLSSVIDHHLTDGFVLRPSYLFALGGLVLVTIAETGRIPVDNPATHLELTMIHEAMLLEYSGRHLALMEWAAQIKLLLYGTLIANVFLPWGIGQGFGAAALGVGLVAVLAKLAALGGPGSGRDGAGEDAALPCPGLPQSGAAAVAAGAAEPCDPGGGGMSLTLLPLLQQGVLVLAAIVLFLSFVLLAQTRLVSAIHAFAWQGALVAAVTTGGGSHRTLPSSLFLGALTLGLKALLIPWMLHRLVRRLELDRHTESLQSPTLVTMAAVALVIFSYWLVLPMIQEELTFTRNIVAISLAVVLIGLLMMVFRAQAVAQVLGFMSMENGLFLAAVSATGGMPLVVELGVAFDVLVAMVLFGVFFLQIRESIDSLDVDRLNRLSETGGDGQ
jgi:formate hydrogenlyase subunit 4/hydrogenase-4 membrane subunit HyfE